MIGFNNDFWKPKWIQPADHAPQLWAAADSAGLALSEKSGGGVIISPTAIGLSCVVLSGVLAAGVALGYRLGHRRGAQVALADESPFFKLEH